MSALKVLVVDDHWIARAAVISLLPQLGDDTEIFEASSGADALAIIAKEGRPGLVILDLNMPGSDPWQMIDRVREATDGARIVVMSASERREDVINCLDRGVVGYLPKSSEPEEIISALRRVMSGEVALPQKIIMSRTSSEPSALSDDADFLRVCSIVDGFTPRQMEVFEFLADGASNSEIAEALGLSVNTVRVHLQTIAAKLDTRRRPALGAFAARWRARQEGADA